MLSRLSLRNSQIVAAAVRGVQTSSSSSTPTSGTGSGGEWRPKRLLEPSPVRHGFIPEEWFTFFYPKTGVTGPYVFFGTLTTYLVSKELYVLEHEFYNGISLVLIWIVLVKKFGPNLKAYLRKSVDDYEAELNSGRMQEIEGNEHIIKEAIKSEWQLEGQKMIYDIKKENILMQLEGTYRERLAEVYSEVKKRLDYHLQIDTVDRRIQQKHMVQWILSQVMKAITPDQEKATLQQCIKDLEALAVKA